MFKLPKKVIEDKQKLKEALEKYLAGELKDAFFKGIRVPWGNYSQRGGKVLMSRLRIPGGILTSGQLRAIGEAARNFADGKLHFTTRQDIQIHNVPFANSLRIVEYLESFNISPRGGGGNTLRNITGCYLSGICPRERIEVYRFVWGLTEHLLALEDSYNLPRKFKISFSGCDEDCAFVGVNDVGFLAVDGGFRVLCGGGMGAKSSVGKILEEKIAPEETGYVTRAIMNVFNKYGDRKNRHHNRLRFLIQNLSWERFVKLYRQELGKLKEAEHIVLRISNGLPELPAGGPAAERREFHDLRFSEFLKYNVGKQKQNGYRYVHLRIPFGEVTAETLMELSELSDLFSAIHFRTTQRQNLVVANVPEDKVPAVYEKVKGILKDFLYPETIYDIISCKAATTCNLGVCNAISLAPEIENKLKERNLNLEKLKDMKININGCPNACGQHPLGSLALSGMSRKVYNRSVPFYKIYLGGKVDAENTKLAEEVGVVPARVVPELITEYVGKPEKAFLTELIKKYSYVPPYEEDRSYYVDFGRTEDFSMEGITQGECGAGVIDMIESDIHSAKQSLVKAKESNFELSEIRHALIYAARALLVVKGIDPKDEKETVSAFVESFVKAGICEPAFGNLEHIYKDILSGRFTGQNAWDYVESLYEEVKKTYSLMDSNFNFQVRFGKEVKAEEKEKISPVEEAVIYDLRGVPCPLNYVKTKIKLEGMKVGELLEVYLDDGEPIRNVPKSLEADGQELVKVEKVEDYYRVTVKKKV